MVTVRTLIVDDHRTLREVLHRVLNGYHALEIVGEACNGEEAIRQVQRLEPDLVILDTGMPLLDGLRAADVIKKLRPETRIVIFAMRDASESVETARNLGLNGFVFKEEGTIVLREAIDAVLQHHRYFPFPSSFAPDTGSPAST
jgi:DNA-binding NarL/FixJ family response regulator